MDSPLWGVTDRGKRAAEAHDTVMRDGGWGRWIACRISDGGWDRAVYDTQADAVKHQIHPTQCAYILVHPTNMPVREASAWLALCERYYDATGGAMPDPAEIGRQLMRAQAPRTVLRDALAPALNRADRRRRNHR